MNTLPPEETTDTTLAGCHPEEAATPAGGITNLFQTMEDDGVVCTNSTKLIPDLVYPVPIIGQIKMGEIVTTEGGAKRPKKNPFFYIASQVKARDEQGGFKDAWVNHPLHDEVAKEPKNLSKIAGENRLTRIPVRVMFNDPGLTLRARYEVFNPHLNTIACAATGDGFAKCITAEGISKRTCHGPDACEFGRANKCRLKGRLNVQVEGQEDEFGAFIFRTAGYNSVQYLQSKLSGIHAMFGGILAHVPLELRIKVKLTPKGEQYIADLCLRSGTKAIEAIKAAKERLREEAEAGMDRAAYEAQVRQLLSNGAFEDTSEEAVQLEDWTIDAVGDVPQFSQNSGAEAKAGAGTGAPPSVKGKKGAPAPAVGLQALKDRLDAKAGGADVKKQEAGQTPAGAVQAPQPEPLPV